jgi:putative transposase
MLRAHKTRFRASSETVDSLYDCQRESARVWNTVLDHAREHHKDNDSWISKSTLQKLTKGKYALAAQSVQAVIHAYEHSRNAARAARAKGYGQKYPYKTKVYFNTTWAIDSFRIVDKRTILLTMGLEAQAGSKRKKRREPLRVRVASLPEG